MAPLGRKGAVHRGARRDRRGDFVSFFSRPCRFWRCGPRGFMLDLCPPAFGRHKQNSVFLRDLCALCGEFFLWFARHSQDWGPSR